jgi:hypothetical protein
VKRFWPRAGWIVAAAAVAVVVGLFDPARWEFYPRCPLYAWTGWLCPGCGSLRALHELLHGRVASAWGQNPLVVLAVPAAALWVWGPLRRCRRWAGWMLTVVLIGFALWRNLAN